MGGILEKFSKSRVFGGENRGRFVFVLVGGVINREKTEKVGQNLEKVGQNSEKVG